VDEASDRDGVADMNENARDLERELDWFVRVLDARLKSYFREANAADPMAIQPPSVDGSDSAWARFLREHNVTPAQRLVILLALIPHVRPQLLDVLLMRNELTGRGCTEFGGVQNASGHGGFLPSGETALFLLSGDDLAARFASMRLFDGDDLLARERVASLAPMSAVEPQLSGVLVLARDYLHRFTTGLERKPGFSSDFPARLVRTDRAWEDLVLPPMTREQLEEIKSWIVHGETLLGDWQMRAKLRPGFTVLFHGPPGTGKTLSACLIGKHAGCDVYKVDLSLIVSKYVGETEKNLARIFDAAEHRRWILFFDEADALFGRRTQVDSAHDRFANQEVSFLLQRIEEFHGVIILASNLKSNIDDAFIRRFQSVLHFPLPRPAERLRLWREAYPAKAELEPKIDIQHLAEKYEMAGGTIMNVVRYASLMALSRGGTVIRLEDVEEGIRRELSKEGRAV
jgi:hypothetical protein